jgi:hypothetical protein
MCSNMIFHYLHVHQSLVNCGLCFSVLSTQLKLLLLRVEKHKSACLFSFRRSNRCIVTHWFLNSILYVRMLNSALHWPLGDNQLLNCSCLSAGWLNLSCQKMCGYIQWWKPCRRPHENLTYISWRLFTFEYSGQKSAMIYIHLICSSCMNKMTMCCLTIIYYWRSYPGPALYLSGPLGEFDKRAP